MPRVQILIGTERYFLNRSKLKTGSGYREKLQAKGLEHSRFIKKKIYHFRICVDRNTLNELTVTFISINFASFYWWL